MNPLFLWIKTVKFPFFIAAIALIVGFSKSITHLSITLHHYLIQRIIRLFNIKI